MSGALRLRAEEEPDLYPAMLARQTLNKTVLDQIVTDMPRTFPNNSHFDSTNPASLQAPLLRILRALANTNPKVGYCQVPKEGLSFLKIYTKLDILAKTVLRIRNVNPGFEFFPSRIQIFSIPDSNFFHPG